MADFFKDQMDYIFFFYGLAFIVLAAVCWILMNRKGERLPWGLLGLFGLIHGVYEWLDLAVFLFGDQAFPGALRCLVMAASFTVLAEFGRAGVVAVRGRGPGRSVFLPLFVLTATGATAGWSGLATAARLVLGLVGGLWASWALLLESRRLPESARRRLAAGGIAMAFYAVLAGLVVPPAPYLPARIFNAEIFIATFGVPVQLLRGLLAVSAACCIWAYAQAPGCAPSGERRTAGARAILPPATLLAIILAGWVLTQISGSHAAREQRREGRFSASILADHLSDTLEDAQRISVERADVPAVAAALQSGGPQDLVRAAAALDLCRHQTGKAPTPCFLLDARGQVVVSCAAGRAAARFAETVTRRGEVLSGAFGGYYAFDDAGRDWNYYAYAPVRDRRGSILGAVVVAENLAPLEESFRKRPYTFLIDRHGLVFLSSSEELCLKSLWPLESQAAIRLRASRQFGSGPFTPLLAEAADDGDFVTLEGQRLLVTRLTVGTEGWSLVLLSSTAHIRSYRLFVIFVVFVLCLATVVFLAVLSASQESTARVAASERMLKKLNDELEQRVGRRTTELLDANERLAEQTVELERSNAELEHFASVVSHDLKAPLFTIGGFAGVVRRRWGEGLDPQARTYLDLICQGTLRMERLIDGLLIYARVGMGAKAGAAVDCNRVLAAALSNLKAAAEECHADISSEHLPVVTGDETQLVRLFQNLIGNALKYRREDPPRIRVFARPGVDAAGWVFSVSDNGIGIDPAHSERIFQIFQRVHADEETFSGMGIGLAVCKKIVESHGGRIWVESVPGKGATFSFTLA
jgi:C4-dicarboxylate-specific signal transduction histidine kinase